MRKDTITLFIRRSKTFIKPSGVWTSLISSIEIYLIHLSLCTCEQYYDELQLMMMVVTLQQGHQLR